MSTKFASAGYAPGWQTDELGEEWVESESPPAKPAHSTLTAKATNAASIKAKRGSLRMLGHASARGLPPSRNASMEAVRIVSGHEGRPLVPSGEFLVPRDNGLLSPPPSDVENAPGPSSLTAGTFVVKDGVEDDRGKAFAKAAAVGKGKDIFGKNALERMFEPPSPPNAEAPPVPLGNTKRVPSTSSEPRRLSHPYAPANPSRLSKSVTPSTASTSTLPMPSGEFNESLIHEQTLPPEGEESFVYPEQADTIEELTRNYTLKSGEVETDLSPFTRPDYPFTYNAPRTASGTTGTGTGSGSATIRGGTIGSEFAPRWDPDEDYQEDGDYPSHSTLHATRPKAAPFTAATPLPIANKRLQLFRSTYDTYTREHLSAMADSFALGESPDSPPRRPEDGSPDSTGSHGSGMSDLGEGTSRSSKRLRLTPPSPRRAPRDWGAQGRALMDKIRIVEDSTTSGSRGGQSTSEDRLDVEESSPSREHDRNDRTHTPPLDILFPSRLANGKPGHRSNPSTTSSGYLRAAEDLMARIKSRVVSGSASGLDNSPHDSQRDLSDVEDDLLGEEATTLAVPLDKGKKRVGPSPRRILRRLSTSEDIRRAAEEDSADDPSPPTSSPPHSFLPSRRPNSQPSLESGAPRPPIPQEQADDLNRFVSATTFATATTATAMTTSFVKHPGPAPAPRNMRMIKPDDVEAFMAERVGRMKYDRAAMKWVRDRPALGTVREGGSEGSGNKTGSGKSEESVDVFAGMDSVGEERVASLPRRTPVAPIAPVATVEDPSESDIEDISNGEPADRSHFVYAEHSETSLSDADSDNLLERVGEGTTIVSSPEILPIRPASSVPPLTHTQDISPPLRRPVPQHASSAPAVLTPAPSGLTKPIRSALRNPNSDTPGIKKRTGFHPELTPGLGRSATRSVSFSDGRKSGKIRDLNAELALAASTKSGPLNQNGDLFADKSSGNLLPSTRTRRITDLLGDMDDLSLEESTPSKPSRTNEPIREPANFAEADTEIGDNTTITGLPVGLRSTRNAGDATFLTECSFGVAHDRLVRLITDVQPFEPYWEDLREIDLSGKGADSVARLKEFLPKVEQINLNNNSLSYLSGIPGCLRVLQAASNRLTSVSSVNHLLNLRVLDLSNNQLDSLSPCLKHLQDLKADNNKIRDISGIFNLEGLVSVSLKGNKISNVDLKEAKWSSLESLDLAQNCFEGIRGLEGLKSLKSLDLESNGLEQVRPQIPMTSLRTLRISSNRLTSLDLAHFPKLRTLYADENSLRSLDRSDGCSNRLEAVSLRNQKVKGLRLSWTELGRVKRLYVSGNHLEPSFFPSTTLQAITYLEAAACQLSEWPTDMARRIPNLEVINVNYNYLEDTDGLRHCNALRKVMLVGNRLCGADRDALRGLRRMNRLEEIDLRMNPLTLGFYLPLMSSPSASSADNDIRTAPNKTAVLIGRPTYTSSNRSTTFHHPFASQSDQGEDWAFMDREFRKKMADGWYTRRLAYRARVMEYTGVKVLDGLDVSEGERRKGRELLARSR